MSFKLPKIKKIKIFIVSTKLIDTHLKRKKFFGILSRHTHINNNYNYLFTYTLANSNNKIIHRRLTLLLASNWYILDNICNLNKLQIFSYKKLCFLRLDYIKITFLTGIDLALLSLANHSIMSYGTFGMWGALLAGGLVTLPRSHMSEGSIKNIIEANMSNFEFL